METVELILDCDHSLPLALECLGNTYGSQIGGVDVLVLVPTVHRLHLEDRPSLTPPPFLVLGDVDWNSYFAHKPHDEIFGTPWGNVHSWHEHDRSVGIANAARVGIRFASEYEDLEKKLELVATHLDQWWESLKGWIEILLSIDMTTHSTDTVLGPTLAWARTDPTSPRRMLRSSQPATIIIHADRESISHACLKRSLSIAGEFEPGLEWSLIRSARHYLWRGHYRTSVLDAATAAELSLTRIIENFLGGTPAAAQKALLDKYKTLGGRGELCKRLGGDLPAEFVHDLVAPRNLATHQGSQLSRQAAEAAERVATLIVERARPLPADTLGASQADATGQTDG